MPTIDLSPYKPVVGTDSDANLIRNAFDALQALLNGGLDTNNLAAAAGIKASQLAADALSGTVAHGTKTSIVSTTGATFATGADVLADALSFTADGSSDYLVTVSANGWATGADGSQSSVRLNLDDADAGFIGTTKDGSANPLYAATPILAPAAGAHTVNVKFVRDEGTGTAQINGGAGGAGANRPILVTIEKL